jgi:PAS domain S-box-containing protein
MEVGLKQSYYFENVFNLLLHRIPTVLKSNHKGIMSGNTGVISLQVTPVNCLPVIAIMLDVLNAIFSSEPFVPHGHCYLWKTGLVGLHVTADALIALAYYSIPIAIFYLVRQRKDLPFKWIFLLFGAFIISCGTTHLLEIWTLWHSTYWISGGMKAITALVSVFTAIGLIPLVPQLLALPSPADLQRLNQELQVSQARVAGILDTANDAIISIDDNQQITLFNRAAEKVFGYTAAEAVGQPLSLLLPQRFSALHHQHISNFREQNGNTRRMGERSEIFGRRKDGTEFPAEASISKLEVAGEKTFTAFLRDITVAKRLEAERQQAEVKLQEQQQFLRQVIDSNPNLVFVKDWDGKFTLANQALAEVYSTSIEEIIGKTDYDFCLNPGDAEQYAHADRQVMQTLQPLLNLEESFVTPEGTIRWFQSTKKPLVSPDGKTRYVLGVANDITTLKETEAALQQKTEELEVFFSSTIDLLCIANTEGYFLRLNPEWENTLGYQLSELEGKRFLDFVHPDDLESTLAATAQLFEQQPILSFTNRYRHQDGSYRWIEWRSTPRGSFIYAAARDITARKQVEAELQLSQERLQLAVEASGEGLWDWRMDTGDVYRSPRYLEILGYDNEQFPKDVKSWEKLLHPDDKARVFDLLNAHFHDSTLQFACEYRMQTKSGEWKWIADYGKVVTWDEQGKPLRMIGTHKDISDRKQAEAALRLIDFSFESSSASAAWIRPDASIMRVNNAACKTLGYSREELQSMHVYDLDPNFPVDLWSEHWQELKQQKHLNFVTQQRTKDGRLLPVEVRLNYVEFDGEEYNFSSMQDISDRLQAEAVLRESEERFRSAFDYSAIGMALVSLDGQWLKVNPALCEIVGYSQEELFNLTFQDITYPDDLEADLADIHQLLIGEIRTYQIEKRYIHKRGQIVWILLTGSLVRNSQKEPAYFITQIQDVTERKLSEAALRESEERWRYALEGNGDGLWDWNVQTNEIFFSRQWRMMHGCAEDEIGNDVTEWDKRVHPDDKASVYAAIKRHISGEVPQYVSEYRILRRDGSYKWILDRGMVMSRDQDGKPLRVMGTHTDISDRKHAEEKLRQSEERLRLALKAAKFGTWEINFITGELFQTDISEIYGLPPGETHKTYAEWKAQVHPDDQSWVQTEFDRAIRTAGEFGFEFRIIRPDTTVRWTYSTGAVVHNELGQPLYAYGIAADITDRKLAEVEQKAHEDFLRQVIDTVPNIIFVKDKAGHILIVNQAGADAHGTTVDAMIGKRETDFNPNFSSTQLEEFLLVNQQVMQSRQPHTELSQSIVDASGKTCWYQTVINPLIDVNGEVTGIVGATTDVTDIKHTEQALQQAKEAAEAANRAKSVFLANMSHELRTPLNVILGFAQVMHRDQSLTLEQRENLLIIRRSSDHLLSLINDVLDLSKIEAGHSTLDVSSVDLIDLLRSIEQMFRQRARTKGLQLHLELASHLPQYVTIDANKLRQILINLLGNAIKFTQQGHVTLRVKAGSSSNETSTHHPVTSSAHRVISLQFEVSDTGVGIATSEQESIFSAFVQTQAGEISPDGTGLGLTISRKFVQMMGGDISVQSTLGHGSTFVFTIAVQVARSTDISTFTTCRVIGLASEQTYRMLVVDDQPENRILLIKLLTQIGLEVKAATNGQEAVTLWQQWRPHLIFMDIRMPLLDGYEATRQIRATPGGQAPIIIALTAQASRGDRTLALAAGCNDYLTKPFQDEVLFSKMAEHLGLKYICADDPVCALDEALLQVPIKLKPADLSTMPSAWIIALHQAARLCDDSEVEHLIEQIPPERASLIKGLCQLAQNYDFKQIVALTRSGATNDHV